MEALIRGMAEAEAGVQGDDDDIFVYMGGNQRVPNGVRRARIHKSVKIVRANAFRDRRQLISVEFHDGVEIIEEGAFYGCDSLRGPIKLMVVKIIKRQAFSCCYHLTDVEFGDELETIEMSAFNSCYSLRKIRMPSVRTVGERAFAWCRQLTDLECTETLEALHTGAFECCFKLERIALPLLKGDMVEGSVFYGCDNLIAVDLVGGIHQTVASLHMESWRNEMTNEINRINQVLPTTTSGRKSAAVQQWMESVINHLDRYKAEHKAILKEATTLLELALWKSKLDGNDGDEVAAPERQRQIERNEIRVTSGADIVIKNILPFLVLKS